MQVVAVARFLISQMQIWEMFNDCKGNGSAHQSQDLREWRQLICTEIIRERRSQRRCM